MSGKPVKPPASKNRPAAFGFVTQALASVTNPTVTGRFLVAGGFTGLPLIFTHRTGAVQN